MREFLIYQQGCVLAHPCARDTGASMHNAILNRRRRARSNPRRWLEHFLGGYSHVLSDGIKHSDIRPFAPFSNYNGLLHMGSIGNLHLLTVSIGIFGGIMLIVILPRRKLVAENDD
jgi:membrane-bound metal-dependent hydrolase YbcI (DUF457 family)